MQIYCSSVQFFGLSLGEQLAHDAIIRAPDRIDREAGYAVWEIGLWPMLGIRSLLLELTVRDSSAVAVGGGNLRGGAV